MYIALPVYHAPSASVVLLVNFSNNLSLSRLLTAMSSKNGVISSAFHLVLVRNSSWKRAAGSIAKESRGKYVRYVLRSEAYFVLVSFEVR